MERWSGRIRIELSTGSGNGVPVVPKSADLFEGWRRHWSVTALKSHMDVYLGSGTETFLRREIFLVLRC